MIASRRHHRVAIALAALLLSTPLALAATPQDPAPTVGVAPAQVDSPESHLAIAKRLFQALDYERALAELDLVVTALEARRSEPTTRQPLTEALELRARTQVGLGRTERAQEDFKALLDITPDHRLAEDVSPRVVAVFTQVRAQTIGQIVVTIEPADAQVRLDGRPIRAGDEPVDLVAGPHVLAALRSGYRPATMDLIADAGRSTPVRLTLERASATIFIVTQPSGADVLVNGASRGRTESAPTGRLGGAPASAQVAAADQSVPLAIGDLVPGAYTVDVRKPCHLAARESLNIDRLDDYRIGPIVLKPAVAALQIGATVGADILLDGHSIGDAPKNVDDVCEGTHVVEARTSTGRDVRTIEVHAGERLTVTLTPRPMLALVDAFAVSDPSRATDLRAQVAATLAGAAGVFVYAPPIADARRIAQSERVSAGWLALDLNRQPLSTGARGMSPESRRDVSTRLSKALDAQGVAAITIPSGSSRIVWLSVLAANSGDPDVIEVNLDQPEAAMKALDAPASLGALLRRSLGVSLVDAMYRPGPVVAEAGAGASRAGLAIGDTITHVNDAAVATAQDLRRVLDSVGNRETVTLRVQGRTGTSRVVEAPIRLEPRIATLTTTSGAANVALIDLRARLRSAGGLEEAALHLNLAALLMRLGSWNAAIAELQAVKLPDTSGVSNGTVQYMLGRCLDALGKPNDAQQAYATAAKTAGSTFGEDGPLISNLVAVRKK
jgi:tetratricopeptide (TPR) repeat protein